MSKIIQFFYSIFKRKRSKSTTEALHIEENKDSPMQLHRDEKTRKGGALKEYQEIIEEIRDETIDTSVGKHEAVKYFIVNRSQAKYFHFNKSEQEDKEDKLFEMLKGEVQTADVKPPLLLNQEQAVEIKHKPTESQNDQISRDNLLLKSKGQDPETQPDQVHDIIMKTGTIPSVKSTNGTQERVNHLEEKEITTPEEQIKALRTTPSKSSDKTFLKQRIRYRKASAKCDFLNESTREGKWWKVSQEKNYTATDHKMPGEQTIHVQSPNERQTTKNVQYDVSPEMLNFKEIVPDVNLNSDLVEAYQDAFEFFRKDKTKCVDMNNLQFSLTTMGIYLTHQDAFEALKSADIDGDGKMNFSDFLAVLTDNQRFLITIVRKRFLPVSEQEYLDTVLFDAISKLLQKSCLPAESAAEIVKYYHEKFKAFSHFPKKKRSKSHAKVDFASNARIMGMTDKQLVHYLRNIKANKGSCASSPYDVVPCVPLSSRKENKLSGHPQLHRLTQKTIYKGAKETSHMDIQKDVSGKKHHGIQVDIYIPGCKRKTNPIPIDLRLTAKKIQKLNMNDHGLVRHQVDLGKKRFLDRAVQRKKSATLHLWNRIHGGQIEQDTRNPVFCDMFSTYSWSWDAQRELLAKKKLSQRETKKQQETDSALLGSGIQQSHMDRNAEHNVFGKSDEKCTDVLSKSSLDFHENPNVIKKPEKEDIVQK